MDTGVLLPELEAFAGLEVGLVDAQKLLCEGAWRLSESEVLDLVRRTHVLTARLESLALGLVREVESRGIAGSVGASSTQALLSGALRISPAVAKSQVVLAQQLSWMPQVGAALADGAICGEQARAITQTIAKLPSNARIEHTDLAQSWLLEKAAIFGAQDLRRFGKRIYEVLDPDGTLDRDEAARKCRDLSVKDNFDGTQTFRWVETDENAALVKAALESLAAPMPGADGAPDPRAPGVRRADAALDLCRRALRFGELPRQRGERPHLHVTVNAADLSAGTGFGATPSGEDLTMAVVRRLSCDAAITAMLLDADGVPLKVGRDVRTVTHGQWIALSERDRGCVFPGCTRPPGWTDAHHVRHWSQGGATDLDNLVLLCGFHHDQVHHAGWEVRFGQDQRPELIPPSWIDPQQVPRRNPYWHAGRDFADRLSDPDP